MRKLLGALVVAATACSSSSDRPLVATLNSPSVVDLDDWTPMASTPEWPRDRQVQAPSCTGLLDDGAGACLNGDPDWVSVDVGWATEGNGSDPNRWQHRLRWSSDVPMYVAIMEWPLWAEVNDNRMLVSSDQPATSGVVAYAGSEEPRFKVVKDGQVATLEMEVTTYEPSTLPP